MVDLKLKHRLIEIDGVPDNLRIAIGETFSLEVMNPDGKAYSWFMDNDPVLADTGLMGDPDNAKKFTATAVGESTIQIQYTENGKNVPTIARAYKVSVVSSEAVDAMLKSKGSERLGAEQG